LSLGAGYWSIIRGPSLVEREENPRRIEAERRIRRGDILDRRGRPLVRSEPQPRGIWKRVYLVPEAAPVVGYSSIDHGTGGVEAAYDAQIRGDRALDPMERLIADLLHQHSVGVSVTLTLDRDMQVEASRALGDWPGAVVLMDARNGDLIALVSQPTYDPNTLETDWPRLQNAPDKPMLNRATQGLYPPGGVFETITLAAAMQEGLADPTSVYTDELGVVLSVDPPISCPDDPPATRFTLAEAYGWPCSAQFARLGLELWPCSAQFARLGLELGGERLTDYATRLGVGQSISLPVEVSVGQLLARGRWSDLIAARTAMGQGEVLVTPLEMATVVPVPGLTLAVGDQVPAREGGARRVLDAEVARQMQDVLASTYEGGRRRAPLPAVPVGGQAAAAESGVIGAPPHAWFIGYAPVSQPRYAVAVIVEHGSDGWNVAAPIGVQVLRRVLQGE